MAKAVSGAPFAGPAANAYADGPPRLVPGYAGLIRMTTMLLAERVPADGRVLVLGAGGGLELKAFADAHPGWSFDGVDPSADMLRLAERTVGPHAARIRLHQGFIGCAPEGPFDGATAILTFHFIPRDERLATLTAIRRRLKPGAPLVVAHVSVPDAEPQRSAWLARHAAFGAPEGTDARQIDAARADARDEALDPVPGAGGGNAARGRLLGHRPLLRRLQLQGLGRVCGRRRAGPITLRSGMIAFPLSLTSLAPYRHAGGAGRCTRANATA